MSSNGPVDHEDPVRTFFQTLPGYLKTDNWEQADCPSCGGHGLLTLQITAEGKSLRCVQCTDAELNAWLNGPAEREDKQSLRDVSDKEFADVDEVGAAAVIGDPNAPLIPEGGNAMVYGDGGVGKTTLCVDLAYHLAAGDDWLGLAIGRKCCVLLVENEGPRPLFRRKIGRKRELWDGSPTEDRVRIIEQPWAQFTFTELERRQQLAELIHERQLDVVIVGPLASSGMETAGTLQDVRAFLALVDDVRDRSGRPVAIILVHHENKGGNVSGAWEGAGDTLIHVTGRGHGKLHLYFQKARWASDLHATGLDLSWSKNDGYLLDEKAEETDDELEAKILAAIHVDPGPGGSWGAVEAKVAGVNTHRRRAIRDRLLEKGLIVNLKREDGSDVALAYCEKGKASKLYPATDPEIAHLLPARPKDSGDDEPLF